MTPGDVLDTLASALAPSCDALAVHTGFSSPMLAWALTTYLATQRQRLAHARAARARHTTPPPRNLLSIQARSVPTVPLDSLLLARLVGSPLTLKLPRETNHPLLDLLPVHVTSLPHESLDLTPFDAIIAYGHDATLEHIQQALQPHQRLIAHGHRVSYVLLTSTPSPDEAHRLAVDLTTWDQLGCMAPEAALLLPEVDADVTLHRLHEALLTIESLRPRRTLSPAGLAELHQRRAFDLFACDEVVEGPTHTLTLSSALPRDATPRSRYLPLVRVDAAERVLHPLLSVLSTVASNNPEHARTLVPGTRVCALGRMQFPAFDAPHDGVHPVDSLFCFT